MKRLIVHQNKFSKNYFYAFFFFCLLLDSCEGDNKKDKGIWQTLSGKEFIYWDVFKPNINHGQPLGSFRFGKDSSCYYFIYSKSDGARNRFEAEDVISENKWRIAADSVIVINSFEYDILILSADSLLISLKKNRDTLRLIKSQIQTDSKNF